MKKQVPFTVSSAAQKIRNIYAEPPKAGWSRRKFLQAITAAGAIPLLTELPSFSQAKRDAGRIKITDIKIQQLIVEKDWGTYTDYVGAQRGGRTGGGAITEIY